MSGAICAEEAMENAENQNRNLGLAVWRGVRGKCPACGKGAILHKYIRPIPECSACGAALAPYQTADFAPYLVTFAIGLIFTPLMLGLSLQPWFGAPAAALLLAAALACAFVLLPRAKGAAIGLLWALDVKAPV